jgi:predicted transcriptional regulator
MTVQVPPELEAKFARLAADTGRTVDQVVLDVLVGWADHDGWFRAEVEQGRRAVADGRLLDHETVVSRMTSRYRG